MVDWVDPDGLTVEVRVRVHSGSPAPTSIEFWIEVLSDAFTEQFGHEPEAKDVKSIENIASNFYSNGAVISDTPDANFMRGSMEMGNIGRPQ